MAKKFENVFLGLEEETPKKTTTSTTKPNLPGTPANGTTTTTTTTTTATSRPAGPLFMGTVDDELNISASNQTKPATPTTPAPAPAPAPVTTPTPSITVPNTVTGPVFMGTVDDKLAVDASKTPTPSVPTNQHPVFMGTVDDKLAIDSALSGGTVQAPVVNRQDTDSGPIFMGTVDDQLALDASKEVVAQNPGASAEELFELIRKLYEYNNASKPVMPQAPTPPTPSAPSTAPTAPTVPTAPTIQAPTVDMPTIDLPTYDNLGGYVAPTYGELESYVAAQLPTYKPQTDQINELYDAAREIQLAQLQNAYDKNVLALEANRAKIPAIYQQQANAVSADSEKQRQAFNEYAAAAGLNSGAGGQASLAMANQLQGDISAIRQQQANAEAELENQLAILKVDYQNSVATAIAQGEYDKAAALMEEYQRAQESAIAIAQAQADENYRAYASKIAAEQEAYNRAVASEQQDYERRVLQEQMNADAAYKKLQLLQQQAELEYKGQLELEKAKLQAEADGIKAQQQAQTDALKNAESQAKMLAQYGDFSGYLALGYTPEQVQYMRDMWLYQNDMEAYREDEKERNGILSGLLGGGDGAGQSGGFLSNLFGNLINGAGSGGTSTPVVNNDTASALEVIYSSVAGSSNPEYMMQIIATEAGIPAADVANWLASRR